jgi:hypothetical protein
MGYETYPLPDKTTKIGQLDERITAQTAALTPLVAKLYAALDGRTNAQAAAFGKVGTKLTRAINGRIRGQAQLAQPVLDDAVAALDNRIATQSNDLAIQSAVIQRLAQTGAALVASGAAGVTGAPPPLAPGGVRGGMPVNPTVPSLPPGVAAPSFSLTPQQIIPAAFGGLAPAAPVSLPASGGAPIRQPSPGAGNCFNWMVLVDCKNRLLQLLCSSDPQFDSLIQGGQYVPIRYSHDYLTEYSPDQGAGELQLGWLADNLKYHQTWIDIAASAYFNNGAGWPPNGDFPHDPPVETAHNGLPVGDWPFDAAGNYLGL